MFQVDGKYAGRSRGTVLDNVDPLARGRIRVRHPLLGDTVWIDYLKLPGVFQVPKKDDIVYVECDCGFESHPIAWGNIAKGDDSDVDLPDAFKRKNPSNSGFYTPDGHLFEFDDGEGLLKTGKGVRLTTSGGIKIHALEGDPTESTVLIEMPNGLTFTINGLDDSMIAAVNFGDTWELSRANGFQVSTPAAGGTALSMKSGEVVLNSAQATVTLGQQGDITVEGPTASASLTKDGDIALEGPVGSATIGKDGAIEIKNAAGSLIINPAGQVELKGAAAGVVDLLIQAFTALSTQTAPGFGAPTSTVAKFAELMAKATAMKAG